MLPTEGALGNTAVLSDHQPAPHLLRVTANDPEYRRLAAAEAAYWEELRPLSFEATELEFSGSPVDSYLNTRFTGDPHTDWVTTIPRWGTFRRGLLLGASSPIRRRLRIDQRFLDELSLVGDAACEAGLLHPGIAFAVYRKRR